MPKKNRKAKENNDQPVEETTATHATESTASGSETVLSDPNPESGSETPVHQAEMPNEESAPEPSLDDLLDEVRHTLIDDETEAEEKEQAKWWKRIKKGSRKTRSEPVKDEPVKEESIPVTPVMEPVSAPEETAAEPDPIDELIEMLESEPQQQMEPAPVAKAEEVVPEPEKIVDVEELKKTAFSHRESEKEEDISEVRAIALGTEDEEVFVEVESTRQDPLEERLKSVENALKPYRSYINLTIAFLGVVMAVIAGILLFNLYKASLPAQPAEDVSNLPYPTSVSLPGGWSFKLAKGSLVDGEWNPRGAEWLQGTEVCRWVALPWSRQLEAVVRTLNPKDPVELMMSNQDKLVYEVYSLRQMSAEEMQALDSNSPCLLIVLAESDSDKRWVLTALP